MHLNTIRLIIIIFEEKWFFLLMHFYFYLFLDAPNKKRKLKISALQSCNFTCKIDEEHTKWMKKREEYKDLITDNIVINPSFANKMLWLLPHRQHFDLYLCHIFRKCLARINRSPRVKFSLMRIRTDPLRK